MSNSKKDFLYYIIDPQGRSLYVRADGVVDRSPVPQWLNSTPDGWQEMSLALGRSEENPGIFRSYTVPIKAIQDGGKIIKTISLTEGIQAEYYLLIQKLNRSTDRHEDYFLGRLDFTTCKGDIDGATITVLEGGLVQYFKNRANNVYEFPLDVPEAVTLVHDGILLKGKVSYIAYNGDSVNLLRNHVAALNLIENEGGAVVGPRSSQRVVIADFNGPTVAGTGQHFLQHNVDGTVTLNITNLRIHVAWTGGTGVNPTPGIGLQIGLRIQEGDTVISTTFLINISGVNNVYGPNITAGKTHVITGTYNLNMPANARLYFLAGVTVVGATGDALTTFDYLPSDTAQMSLDFQSRYQPTRMKVLRPEYLWNELIKKISDGRYTGESIPLRTKFKNTVVTSGDGARGLSGAVIKTSLNDFVKSYYGMHAVSPSITDFTATMEEMPFFFTAENIIDLTLFGDVNNLQWEWIQSYIPSEIIVGTPDQTYDDLNGRDETNTLFKFQTVISEQENTFDYRTPYRRDAYGLEYARQNLTNKKTTDADSDNDRFMIDIAETSFSGNVVFSGLINAFTTVGRFQSVFVGSKITVTGTALNDGVYDVIEVLKTDLQSVITVAQPTVAETITATITSNEAALNRPVFDSITGVIAPESIYNILLSPKRSLLAHGPEIRSGLDLKDATNLTFLSADKNDKLSTTVGGVTITEKAPVLVSSLGAPLFRPFRLRFDTEVPIKFSDLVGLPVIKKYGRIKLAWKGNIYYAHIEDVKQVPQLNPKQTWSCICAAGVNILPLING